MANVVHKVRGPIKLSGRKSFFTCFVLTILTRGVDINVNDSDEECNVVIHTTINNHTVQEINII